MKVWSRPSTGFRYAQHLASKYLASKKKLWKKLLEVLISNLQEGVFYSTLVYSKPEGTNLEVDSRTSDALALAVRFGCPIYANANVLEEAAIAVEEEDEDEAIQATLRSSNNPDAPLSSISSIDLEKLLNDSLANEDYERAAEIRDELRTRKEKS